LAFVLGPGIIRLLRDRHVGQVIRAEGPASHAGKRGTPTMGGLIILLATVAPTLLWARLDTRYAVVAVAAMLWMGAIGFLDDYLKIVRGKSQGLVARWKLIGQISFGLALGLFLLSSPLAPNLPPTSTQLPVFKYQLIVFWPATYVLFVTLVVTGSSNAVNLTDGLGGPFGTVAILLKAEFLLLIVGGVFAAETVSVMLQTSVYRWHKTRRGKEYADAHRVFRMAPLHHHFEKLGWAEPQVVMRFYIMGVLCAAIALATLKVR